MSKDEKGYNGWENYETWATKLWLDNSADIYDMVREWANKSRMPSYANMKRSQAT